MRHLLRLLLLFLGAATLAACASAAQPQTQGSAAAARTGAPRVLIFSHSTGYRHASIEPGVAALRAMGERAGMSVTASENPNLFTTEGLCDVDAIIFLSTSTDPKKPDTEWFVGPRREALQAFVRRGGGIVGIHAAADSHYHWPWYGRLIGGRFASHPEGTPTGTLHVTEPRHPSTVGLPTSISRADEWYYFNDHNAESDVLVTLDPASIGQTDVNPNPVSWAHEFEGGRVFYTAMGHTNESYADPNVLRHIEGGLNWVMRR